MSETANLSLPLLQSAQAQKHVTVNEALTRLDALVQLRLQSVAVLNPPVDAADGQAWAVPVGATDEWSGQDGRIAIRDNGGWVYAAPLAGWRAWVVDDSVEMRFGAADWQPVDAVAGPSGAATIFHVMEFDHPVAAGGVQSTATLIPSHAMVLGVTARVISEITGTLGAWSLGADGSVNRFGSGLGLGLNSYARGVLGSPLTNYAPLPLDLTPEGGEFAGGAVRFAVHYAELTLPAEV
jgi:hypothetical protein